MLFQGFHLILKGFNQFWRENLCGDSKMRNVYFVTFDPDHSMFFQKCFTSSNLQKMFGLGRRGTVPFCLAFLFLFLFSLLPLSASHPAPISPAPLFNFLPISTSPLLAVSAFSDWQWHFPPSHPFHSHPLPFLNPPSSSETVISAFLGPYEPGTWLHKTTLKWYPFPIYLSSLLLHSVSSSPVTLLLPFLHHIYHFPNPKMNNMLSFLFFLPPLCLPSLWSFSLFSCNCHLPHTVALNHGSCDEESDSSMLRGVITISS